MTSRAAPRVLLDSPTGLKHGCLPRCLTDSRCATLIDSLEIPEGRHGQLRLVISGGYRSVVGEDAVTRLIIDFVVAQRLGRAAPRAFGPFGRAQPRPRQSHGVAASASSTSGHGSPRQIA